MASRAFVVWTLVVSALLAALVGGVNGWIDFYGLYEGEPGHERTIASNDRFGTYLFAFRHIPLNYDALLVGSSISANIDTRLVAGVRMYNLSISAANIADEALLLNKALDAGHYRLVVFCLNPYLVKDTVQQGGGLASRDYWAGLGSLPLFEDYGIRVAEHLGLYPRRFNPWGGEMLGPRAPGTPDGDQALASFLRDTPPEQRDHFTIDPAAVQMLDESIERVRSTGARVVAVFPPVYEPRYQAMRPAYAEFEDRMRELFRPGETVLAFNDGSLDAVTKDPANFRGHPHYDIEAADLLGRALADAIAR